MKKIVLLLLLSGSLSYSQAQYYRWVFHKDQPVTLASNSAAKITWLELYARKMNDIKKAREKTLEYFLVVENVQRTTHNALTNVNTALKNGKTVVLIYKRIELIYDNLKQLSALALNKPYLANMAVDQAGLFTARLTGLAAYLQNVVLKPDKETLMDPVKRTKMVTDIYDDVWALYGISRALVNIFKIYNLQDAMNKVVPYRDWYKNDKAIADDILKNIKF